MDEKKDEEKIFIERAEKLLQKIAELQDTFKDGIKIEVKGGHSESHIDVNKNGGGCSRFLFVFFILFLVAAMFS